MATQMIQNHTYIDGNQIAFYEQGSGSAVILIHGIPTNSLMWRNIIPQLAKTHRVIAPDLLNYGESAKPENADVSINAQSHMLAKFLDAIGERNADIVGHDIGGGIAQLLAVNYPEKVSKLVLMDSICFDSWPIPEFEPLQEPAAESEMSLDDFLDMMRGFLPKGVNDKSVMTEELIDQYLKPWSSETGKKAFFRNLRRLNKEYTLAVSDQLKQLPHKTLVMWGEKDPFQKPEYAPKLAAEIPNSDLIWVADAGHWLIDEKPTEVGENLIRFLG